MKRIITIIIATIISLGALAAWYYVAPADGSEWILFVAFVGGVGFVPSLKSSAASIIVSVGAGLTWYLHRDVQYSGWVLAIAILSILAAFQFLQASSRRTKTTKK